MLSLHNIEAVVSRAVGERLSAQVPVLVGIDGPCASGKTTLAEALARRYNGNVFHMDDFFLPLAMKTPARLRTPGGNVHYERVLQEVLLPLCEGREVTFRKYDCHSGRLLPAVTAPPKRLSIVEGSYSLHPALREFYSLKVVLDIDREEQLVRIRQREEAAAAKRFEEEWIPLEKLYFEKCGVFACADIRP